MEWVKKQKRVWTQQKDDGVHTTYFCRLNVIDDYNHNMGFVDITDRLRLMYAGRSNRQWRLTRRPKGPPAREDFELSEAPIPVPSEGQMLTRTVYLSLDPYKTGVPMADEDLIPELVAIAKEHFGAVDK